MSAESPIEMVWKDGCLHPISSYWLRRADKMFIEGCVYRIIDQPERSSASHNAFFASVQEAWSSLPPLMAERFHSADALRKYALVKAGYCYSDNIVCPSHADAMRVAAFARTGDEFALVDVKKNVVTRYRPKSQSYRAMGRAEFNASKEAVLAVIAELLDVTKGELSNAGVAA